MLLLVPTLSLLILNELLRDNAGDRDSKFCILTVYGHENNAFKNRNEKERNNKKKRA
jgi:hypothetical protein